MSRATGVIEAQLEEAVIRQYCQHLKLPSVAGEFSRLAEGVPSVARREILASLGLSLPPVSKFFHRRQ